MVKLDLVRCTIFIGYRVVQMYLLISILFSCAHKRRGMYCCPFPFFSFLRHYLVFMFENGFEKYFLIFYKTNICKMFLAYFFFMFIDILLK